MDRSVIRPVRLPKKFARPAEVSVVDLLPAARRTDKPDLLEKGKRLLAFLAPEGRLNPPD